MSILNFVKQEQLDNLDDDPRKAFMEIVNYAQRSLDGKLSNIAEDDETSWRAAEDIRHSFMNVIVASSKRFEIEPFASMDMPRINDNLNFSQFKSDLDHYVTQLVLDNSAQKRRDSVTILPASKDKIRSYIHGLRDCIEKANMVEAKRSKLLDRLDELENELEKRRANMLLIAKLAFDVLAIPGGTWASVEIATKLITNISQPVEEAREVEQANMPVIAVPKSVPALSPPRSPEQQRRGMGGGFADDLDDDVPF
jgi:hypothetical protein